MWKVLEFLVASSKARKRIAQLEEAIRKHKSNTGNNLCWENDIELWSVLGEAKYPHDTLLPKKQFLRNCENYFESRLYDKRNTNNNG